MALDPQLKAQLKQVVTISVPATVDIAGQISTVSAATFWSRTEAYFREVMVGGVLEKTTHRVILSEVPGSTITETQMRGAQIWLTGLTPTNDPTEARRAKSVHYCVDADGALDHIELVL